MVFLLSAVHEIRSHEEKIFFLKECHRLCTPEGKVIMVEHLRVFPNFRETKFTFSGLSGWSIVLHYSFGLRCCYTCTLSFAAYINKLLLTRGSKDILCMHL
ncbi:MAG: hypothetical protein J0H74_32255 [Chitinophagaceae bacterium]|nr:hypothetical protein [Chitinophagaceae bacterium]